MEETFPGKIINLEAPFLYRLITKKLLDRFPQRRITRGEAKRILGVCFKIGKNKNVVFKELEGYGLLIPSRRNEYYIAYEEIG